MIAAHQQLSPSVCSIFGQLEVWLESRQTSSELVCVQMMDTRERSSTLRVVKCLFTLGVRSLLATFSPSISTTAGHWMHFTHFKATKRQFQERRRSVSLTQDTLSHSIIGQFAIPCNSSSETVSLEKANQYGISLLLVGIVNLANFCPQSQRGIGKWRKGGVSRGVKMHCLRVGKVIK